VGFTLAADCDYFGSSFLCLSCALSYAFPFFSSSVLRSLAQPGPAQCPVSPIPPPVLLPSRFHFHFLLRFLFSLARYTSSFSFALHSLAHSLILSYQCCALRPLPLLRPDQGRAQGETAARKVLVYKVDRDVYVVSGVRGECDCLVVVYHDSFFRLFLIAFGWGWGCAVPAS
jgi:hypothetical protein